MQSGKALSAGVLGALAMTLVMAGARALGLSVNLEMTLGAMLTGTISAGTWLVGFLVHVAGGGFLGLAYGAIFEHVTHRAGPSVGLALGVVHAMAAGVALGAMSPLHPMIPESLPAPGMFLAEHGILAVFVFIGVQLLFGLIVGALYPPVRIEPEHHHAARA